MMSDIWVLRNRHLNLTSLYRHLDIYSFFHGFNLRAFLAFACGIALNLAGLAKATGNKHVPKGAIFVYSLSWLVGTNMAFVVYTVVGKIWPMEDPFNECKVVGLRLWTALKHQASATATETMQRFRWM
jgi:NCS1 family nucleobase:cation symporter-1